MHNVLTTETKVKTINSDKNKKQMINLHMHVHACVCVCRSFPFPWLKMARGNKSGNGQPRLHCSCQLPENGKYYASVLLSQAQAQAQALALALARTSRPGHCSAAEVHLSHPHTCAALCVLKVSVCLAA